MYKKSKYIIRGTTDHMWLQSKLRRKASKVFHSEQLICNDSQPFTFYLSNSTAIYFLSFAHTLKVFLVC